MGDFDKKRDLKQKYQKDISTKEKKRERERKESEYCNYLYNLSLLEQACGGKYALLFYKINLFFSILILRQNPLLLFISLSYKFY